MKYAREVIELMSAYPERRFRMQEPVRYVAPKAEGAIGSASETEFCASLEIWCERNQLNGREAKSAEPLGCIGGGKKCHT